MFLTKATRVTAAVAALAACAAAGAAPVTFFGEDSGLGDGNGQLASTPNADAKYAEFMSYLTGGVRTEDFENVVSGLEPNESESVSGRSVSFGDISATISSGSIERRLLGDSQGRYPTSPSHYLVGSSRDFSINFSQAVAAFGFYGIDIGDFAGRLSLRFTLAGGGTVDQDIAHSVNAAGGSVLFFGYIDTDNPFTAVTFRNSSFPSTAVDGFGFDDFTIGSVSQVQPPTGVPEPGTLALVGASLFAMGALRRRRI